MNKKFYWLAGFAALMMTAACSDDNVVNDNPTPGPEPVESTSITLDVVDGASQAARIHMVPQTKAVGGVKKNRLNFVGSISAPDDRAGNVWSTTSLLVDDRGSNTVYVTWHADKQATTPATVWGGALDVINFEDEANPSLDNPTNPNMFIQATYVDDRTMKFEHVMKSGSYMFVSGTHATKGAVVLRLPMANLTDGQMIGLPGSSVNCLAEYKDGMLAVTGFEGTWVTFKPDITPAFYDYENPENNTDLTLKQPLSKDFGGKYVAVNEQNYGYVLRTTKDKAQILGVAQGKVVVDDMVPLISDKKGAESYDPTTGDWTVGAATSPLQGKHVMVIKDGYAYIGAGLNGLRVYNLTTQEEVKNFDDEKGGPNTIGLCIDGDLLYAATGSGLRVYKMLGEGQLELYAFEVDKYDANGLPDSVTPPTTMDEGEATPGHHSANFVSVLTKGSDKYIFVAYGQDGVRVYKLNPNAGGEEEEVTE